MSAHRLTRWLPVLLLVLAQFGMAVAQDSPGASPELNKNFIDPNLDVEVWIQRFEVESREVYAARNAVLRATGVKRGSRVADIGAGTGLYTRLFSEVVGAKGWVYAVDIGPAFLEHINKRSAADGLTNVTSILGRSDTITLPPNSIDVAFICDTYHHFEAVETTLASIRRALASGGRLIVIDFERNSETSRPFIMEHVRAGKDVFRQEIEAAGFAFEEQVAVAGLEENYFLMFKKK